MVQFSPYTNPDRDPKYDFREPDGRKANTFWGDLAKGAAGLLDSGIKSFDTATNLTLDAETKGFVDTFRNQNIREHQEVVGNILAATGKAPTTPTGASPVASGNVTVSDPSLLNNSPGTSPATNNTIPGPLSSELRVVDKMNEGWRQGHFDSERFYGELQQRTANLISRYPGYADYIQSKVTHYLGTDPANAQREHLQQTIRQLLGTNNHEQTAAERWNHEVMDKYAAIMGPAFTQAALQAVGNPTAQMQFRVIASTELAKNEARKVSLQQFELKKAAGTATQDDTVKTATQNFDASFAKLMNTTKMASAGWTGTVNDIHDRLAEQRLNGKPDIEANQRYALAIGDMQAKWEANFEQEWVKPRFGTNPNTGQPSGSWSTDIKDPAVKEQIMKKYATLFDSFKRQVGAGQFDLATTVADLSSKKLDNAVANLYEDQSVLALSAGTKAFGQGFDTVYGSANLRSNMALNNQLSQTFLKAALGKTMANGDKNNNNLLSAAEAHKKALEADARTAGQRLPPKFIETAMTNLTEVITNPSKDIPLQVRFNAVEVLSNPNTPGFLNLISKEQQFKAYGVLYSPMVTNFIKDHKATEIGERYKTSAGESFVSIYGTYANELKSTIRNDYRGTYTWNEKTNQIVYTPTKAGFTDRDVTLNPAAIAVRQLNEGLRTYASILEAYGEKITPETFTALGIDLSKPEGNPTLDQIKKTWSSIIPPGTKTERTPSPSTSTIPKVPRTPAPGDLRMPAPPAVVTPLKGDGVNDSVTSKRPAATLSQEEIEQHAIRPLKIDGKEILDPLEKINVLKNIMRTPEGKYYYRKGSKLYPLNLD